MLSLITILLCILSARSAIDPSKLVYAVNCGGERYTTPDGIVYAADKGYSAGMASDYGVQFAIKYTKSPVVYQTERYALDTFEYEIPLSSPGDYVLILKFSEVYFNAEGEKVFHIKIGNKTVVHSLDIYKKVGRSAAYDEFIELQVRDGKLFHGGQEVSEGWNGTTLKVQFVKTGRDNPKVNGIVLVQGGLKDTNYLEMKSLLEQRQKAEEANRAKEQAKAIEEEERQENEVLDFESFEKEVKFEETESLLAVMSSRPALGVIGIVVLLVSFALFSSKNSKTKPN